MPHVSMEYSANLDGRVDVDALCRIVRGALVETGLFEDGAIRVRAMRCEHFAIADLAPENAFIDMSFRLGVGRTEGQKIRAGDAIFAAVQYHLADLFREPYFALSLEIREIDASLSWKHNTMHARLRAG